MSKGTARLKRLQQMDSIEKRDGKPSFKNRFFTSPFLLLVVLLIAVDGVVVYLQSLDKKNQFQQNTRLLAIRSAIEGNRKPDVFVLGDSLIYSALFFADSSQGFVADQSQAFTYLEAQYLSQELKDKLGKKVDVLNLSMPGSNPTDAYLILSELEARGKLPKLVLYGASPRGMADNLVPTAGAIGGKLALNVEPSGDAAEGIQGAIARVVHNISDWDPVANKIREYGQLGDSAGPDKIRDFYTGIVWNYFHDRAKVRSQLEVATLQAFGRKVDPTRLALNEVCAPEPPKRPKGNKKKAGPRKFYQVPPEVFERDLNNYRVRYNPPNFSKLEKQSEQLEKIADLLKKHDTHFFVVSMPVSPDNKDLIPDELLAEYKKCLNQLATRDGVTVLDLLSTAEFKKPSFLDSAHLNGDGAVRLDHKLVSSMDRSWF